MIVSAVETMVGGISHVQEYVSIPPVTKDEMPHVPALFIGSDFDAAIAIQVEALSCRQLVALDVPHEGLQLSARRILLGDALGALLLENPFTVLTSVALGPDGADDLYEQIEDDGPLREFGSYIFPYSTRRELDVSPMARKCLVVDYFDDTLPDGHAKTPLQNYLAIGDALQGHDRRVFAHAYKLRPVR
ncbi:MAG TPA: hypothetical protein VLI54_04410 [Bacillota bacterium]|nr:hypothetical protein [Bacillota bacterium]